MGTPDTSVQLQPLPRLGRGHDPRAHGLDDGARLLDQLRVARIHPAAEIKVVLQPHAHVAAEQYRLRDPRHLHAAQREGAPHAWRGQRVHHGEQVPDVRGHPVGDAGAQLDHGGGGDQAFLDQLLHEGQITGVEHFQLHFHAQVTQDASAVTLVVGRGNVGAVAIAEVERTAVEGGDLGAVQSLAAQLDDVPHALLLAHEVGPGGRGVLEAAPADTDIAPHAAGEVYEHVDLAFPDALDDLAVVAGRHAELAGFRVAHMDVHDRGPGARRVDGGSRDLLGRDRAVRALGDPAVVAGDGAGDDDVAVHGGGFSGARCAPGGNIIATTI